MESKPGEGNVRRLIDAAMSFHCRRTSNSRRSSLDSSFLTGAGSIHRVLRVCVAALALWSAFSLAAGTPSFPGRSPLNAEFVDFWRASRPISRGACLTEEGYALGLVPSPVDLSHMTAASAQGISPRDRLSLPASYDLRSLGRLTPVKDQGGCGSCWAFATMGSLESWLLTL